MFLSATLPKNQPWKQGLPMKLDGLEDDPFLLERPILAGWWFQPY